MTHGIHRLPMSEYLADPCPEPSLSAGIAGILIAKSPLHAKWAHPRLSPRYLQDRDEKFDIGTTAHSLILENDETKICVINPEDYPSQKGGIPDGWTNKAIKAARDTARANGLTPILAKHHAAVKEMVGVAREFMQTCEIARYIKDADAELTCVTQHNGLWLRARPDLLSKDRKVIVNYKTTENASPDTFIRQINRMGYDLDAVFYERVMKNLGHSSEQFFIAQEVSPPYACVLAGLDPAAREVAQGKLNVALGMWERCMQSGRWNAYPGRVHYVSPSVWELDQAEERRLTFDEIIERASAL